MPRFGPRRLVGAFAGTVRMNGDVSVVRFLLELDRMEFFVYATRETVRAHPPSD